MKQSSIRVRIQFFATQTPKLIPLKDRVLGGFAAERFMRKNANWHQWTGIHKKRMEFMQKVKMMRGKFE
jgi:hypothetical protein